MDAMLVRPWTRHSQATYIFKKATIIDPLEGIIIETKNVKISNGVIDMVTDRDIDETNAIFVDLSGKYLCPGLIDCHVHLCATPGANDLGSTFGMDSTRSLLRQPYVCQQMLSRGFTTVRDCGGASYALKEAIQEGVCSGPRLFIAGRALSQTGGHADLRGVHNHTDCCGGAMNQLGRLCDGVPECIKYTREELRLGADFIKIMAGGGVTTPTDALTNVQFTAEEIRAITTVAANNNTWVTAHAYTPRSIRQAIENGVQGIEHGNMIDEETAAYMVEKDAFLTPTLVTYSEMASPKWTGYLPPESATKNEEVLQAGLQALKLASDAGVTICYGTDLLGPLGIAQTREFRIRSEALSPLEILRSATTNAARLLRQELFLGQIKAGFAADLLILNENPLKNIEVFDEPETHLLAIIKEGRVESSRWTKLPQDIHVNLQVIE